MKGIGLKSMRIPNEIQTYKLLGCINLKKPFGPRDHAMIRLALHTGLRVSELTGLDICHVWVLGAPRAWLDLPASICKGHRSGQIPLNPYAQRAITDLVRFLQARGFSTEPDAPLLTDHRHRRLPTREVQRCIQKYRELAGLDIRVTPHSLRHAFASRLVEQGASTSRVQHLSRHKLLTTTQIYIHTQPDDLVETVCLLQGP